jgi:ribosomal protein L7Ae-like RNA K-turn-binding protein
VNVDAATERRLLGLLGLGLRSRGAVVGVERVRDAAKRGRLAAAVVAPDASKHSRDKVLPLLAARKIPVVEGPNAAALGAVCGREATAVVGIVDHDLARGVKALAGATEVSARDATKRARTGRRTA